MQQSSHRPENAAGTIAAERTAILPGQFSELGTRGMPGGSWGMQQLWALTCLTLWTLVSGTVWLLALVVVGIPLLLINLFKPGNSHEVDGE